VILSVGLDVKISYIKSMHSVRITIEVTKKCKGNCAHCYLACKDTGDSLSFENLKIINKKIKEVNILARDNDFEFQISSITGGDPFIYEDDKKNLSDIVDYLLGNYTNLDIHVSGWMESPKFLNNLKNKNINYFISYTPYMPLYEQRIGNAIGNLEMITENLFIDVICKKEEKDIHLNSLVNLLKSLGYQESKEGYKKDNNKIEISHREVFPFGRGSSIVKSCPEDMVCVYAKEKDFTYQYVDIHGNLYPCSRAGATYIKPICNFFEDSSLEIIQKHLLSRELKKIFNITVEDTCEGCRRFYNSWLEGVWFFNLSEQEFFRKIAKRKLSSINKKIFLIKKKDKSYRRDIQLAYLYEKVGDFKKAEKKFLKILEEAKKKNSPKYIAEINKDLSIIYRVLGKEGESKKLLDNALEIALKNKLHRTEANIYGNLGIRFFHKGKYDLAIKMHRKALEIHSKSHDEKREIANLSFIGINKLFLNKEQAAEKYLNQALKRSYESKYVEGIADTKYHLAILKMMRKDYISSSIDSITAAQIYWQTNDIYKFMQSLVLLKSTYEKQGLSELVIKIELIYNTVKEIYDNKG